MIAVDADTDSQGVAFTQGAAVAGSTADSIIKPDLDTYIGDADGNATAVYTTGNLELQSLYNYEVTADGISQLDDPDRQITATASSPAGRL